MRRYWLVWLSLFLATTFGGLALIPGDGTSASAALLLQATPTLVVQTATLPAEPPTATSVPTATTEVATATPVPTVVEGPDLTVTLFDSPNPVPSGGVLTYSMLVTNSGGTASGGTTIFVSIPAGTTGTTVGPNCVFVGGGVTCNVPPLGPGGTSGFTFTVNVAAAQGNLINAVAIVDPSGVIAESDESNNTSTATTFVAGAVVGPTFTPVPPVLPTETPIVIVVTPTPVPGEPAPPPPPPAPPVGQLWLLVVAETQTYGIDDNPAWIAQPGEWYIVLGQEAGWALAYWEGDAPDWAVWIQEDGRVQLSVQDRPIPPGDLWVLVNGATQVYTQTDEPAWIAQPGEWYRVLSQDAGWALAHWEGDPPESAVWIELDARVQLTRA